AAAAARAARSAAPTAAAARSGPASAPIAAARAARSATARAVASAIRSDTPAVTKWAGPGRERRVSSPAPRAGPLSSVVLYPRERQEEVVVDPGLPGGQGDAGDQDARAAAGGAVQ